MTSTTATSPGKPADYKQLRDAYRQLNASFRPVCVYHIGASGFFSEYNMMLLAMLYCLVRRIRFVLYSADANFAYRQGWTDFFEPFCEESHDRVHHYLNHRATADWATVWRLALHHHNPGLIGNKLKRYAINACTFVHKQTHGIRYYTQDIWHDMLAMKLHDHYRIAELDIDGDMPAALRQLARLTWSFNPETRADVDALTASLNLSAVYAGCQIRGGDKFTEFDLITPEAYVRAFDAHGHAGDIFVLTDDYRIMEQLQRLYPPPRYHWHTLCQPAEQGYYHRAFVSHSKADIRRQLTRFLASMDVLCRASFYVGTRTSNPSVFLFIYRPDRCLDADGQGELLAHSTLGIS